MDAVVLRYISDADAIQMAKDRLAQTHDITRIESLRPSELLNQFFNLVDGGEIELDAYRQA